MNTTRKLLAGGIALAATIGPIAVASDASAATSYLSVSLGAFGAGASAVWDSAGNPDLTVGSSNSYADVVINTLEGGGAPADAPAFTTDNYAAGSPSWIITFTGGDELVGYPSQAGLGTSNWSVKAGPSIVQCTVANRPVNVTYAAALTFMQNSKCGGHMVARAEIIAEGQSAGASDDLSNISYNGETLVPGPDVVTVTSPGQQTTPLGTSIGLRISASSDKGDGFKAFTATGLPPGLSIADDGLIFGTPTVIGSSTVTVTATDNGGTTGSVTFGWTIGPAAVTYSGTIRLYKLGYCLDDRNNSSSNGAVVQVWRCNGLANQRWQVMSDGTIRHNGLCLDASGYGTANATKVQLWACTGNGNQKWDTTNFRIHYDNPATTQGKVLDDTGYGGNGTQQEIWTPTGGANQLWETY